MRNQIFGRYDLPASISPNPSIGPRKASTLTSASFPRFVALCNGRLAVKPDFDLINTIGNEILRRISCVGDHFRLVVKRPFRVDTQEIIGKNPFDHGWVASGYQFGSLTFTFYNVALCFLLVVSRALTKQATKRASNNKHVDFHFAGPMVTLSREP